MTTKNSLNVIREMTSLTNKFLHPNKPVAVTKQRFQGIRVFI